MRNYSCFAMPRAKTINHRLENLSYIGSKLRDSIPSHMMYLLMNLNMLVKLRNLIYAQGDFAKFIYKILDICSQQKKIHNVYKNTFMSKNQNIIIVFSRSPNVVHLLFLA